VHLGEAFELRRGAAWRLVAESFLTPDGGPVFALRNTMREAFGLAGEHIGGTLKVPAGGAEGRRVKLGEHLLICDTADSLVARIALFPPDAAPS